MSTERRRLPFVRLVLFGMVLFVTASATWLLMRIVAGRVNPVFAIGITFAVVGFAYGKCRQLLLKSEQQHPASSTAVTEGEIGSELPRDYGRIYIRRDAGYADKYRAYTVIVDDEPVGSLVAGETASFSVPFGQHRVAVMVDWAGSNTLQVYVSPQHAERLKVRSNLRGARILLGLWYVLFARNSYLRLEPCVAPPRVA
jgi:hypothetical protein